MKRIISALIIAAMMTGCGKLQQLSQPVETKTVEVPAKFSWKNEFTGNRLILKVGTGALIGLVGFAAYKVRYGTGRVDEARENTTFFRLQRTIENRNNDILAQQQQIAALENRVLQLAAQNQVLYDQIYPNHPELLQQQVQY
jgi:cell division protein FtsB